MALSERLKTTPQRQTGLPCSVGALLDVLPVDEASALEQMMGPLGWSASRIYEALAAEGHEVGRQTIGRHRSRACRCFGAAA
jgi:hypothetical protein